MKYYFVISVLILGCSHKNIDSVNKFSDEGIVNIYDLQDQRKTNELLPYLKAKKESHRITAALAFASIQDTIAIPYLNQMLQIDQDPLPRRAAAFALGQIGHPVALPMLKSAFDNELHNPNRRYILEAIGKCGEYSTLSLFENTSYTDSSIRLGWIYGVIRLGQRGFYSDSLNHRVIQMVNDPCKSIARIAAASALKLIHAEKYILDIDSFVKTLVSSEIAQQFNIVNNPKKYETYNNNWLNTYLELTPYKQSKKISELKGEDAKKFLYSQILSAATHPIIKNEAFIRYCELYPSHKWDLITTVLADTNMALISLAGYEIQSTDVRDLDSMSKQRLIHLCSAAQKKLILPRQTETFIDLSNALYALTQIRQPLYKPSYNHPIDWKHVQRIPKNQQVSILTNRGKIILELYVEDAPGTVSNFLKLVTNGFYNGKFFHRVVPQFVIQGGCPRGDGWGSLNWSQRSELSHFKSYKTGTVGVASAGKDTEGVQFFITHCPTPHLDGRYTLFGRVIKGMEVVHQIEIGDIIQTIKILETT